MANTNHRYIDAIGYLDELVEKINQSWFRRLRDNVVLENSSTLDPEALECICNILLGEPAELPPVVTVNQPAVSTISGLATDFLEQLCSFSNFKLLNCDLKLVFPQQITLVFGTNGSGKSSLCDALKILANPDMPRRPIQNLRSGSVDPSSFIYKFRSNTTEKTWTPALGYGIYADRIKYFDTSVTDHNITAAIEPGRVITLTPFKLGIFESMKHHISQIREALQNKQTTHLSQLDRLLIDIHNDFENFKDSPLRSIDHTSIEIVIHEISIAEAFDDAEQTRLAELTVSEQEYEKASSETGLKALRLEHQELEKTLKDIITICDSAEALWVIKPNEKQSLLDKKVSEQKLLAALLLPDGVSLEKLLELIESANSICNLSNATTSDVCPLCRRTLEDKQIQLFRQYFELVAGKLDEEIKGLRMQLSKAVSLIDIIKAIDINVWIQRDTITPELISKAMEYIGVILPACNLIDVPSPEASMAIVNLREQYDVNMQLLSTKKHVIDDSILGRDLTMKKLNELHAQINPLRYKAFLKERVIKLREIEREMKKLEAFTNAINEFPSILKRITSQSKLAYDELVVGDFEERLNNEYIRLSEKDMRAFRVDLKRVGSDAIVTIKPQVRGHEIDEVLSEGELHIHALALFFAELECACPPILVFDDPISSFDYNYIENFCNRLRDFALLHTSCQIILLTHNWEFFVQLQSRLHKVGLESKLSVQVLEGCCSVAEYSENIKNLKNEIIAILNQPNELIKPQKDEIAGKMRRLIESIVNTYVFNNQRQQYKQKSYNVSVFKEYTKITPLTSNEAIALSDLFSKLSPSDHDDQRNDYINTDKAMFQTRYDQIVNIETAIKLRITC